MGSIIIMLLIGATAWHFWGRRYWRLTRARDSLVELEDFSPTFYAVGENHAAVAVDAATGRVAFVDPSGRANVYDGRQIVNVDIYRNSVSVSKTNRVSQLISALFWDWLFGPKGFRVGGLTGSTTMSDRVNAISLKVHVNDVVSPVKEIVFYRGPAIDVGGARYRHCAMLAEEWEARLCVVKSETSPSPKGTSAPSRSHSRLLGKTYRG
jgi:hypothetical protein